MEEQDQRRLGAAVFLSQALDLADDPVVIAADLALVNEDLAVAVYAAELESSIGPTAFLVYAFDLEAEDEDGRSGASRFDDDLATLERAASLDAPGPRSVAHAQTAPLAFILATSPATLRALIGESPAAADTPVVTSPVNPDLLKIRRTAAAALLRHLRAANDQAEIWAGAHGNEPLGVLTPEETALALFLLDERSIRSLLGVLDAMLTAAKRQASGDSGLLLG